MAHGRQKSMSKKKSPEPIDLVWRAVHRPTVVEPSAQAEVGVLLVGSQTELEGIVPVRWLVRQGQVTAAVWTESFKRCLVTVEDEVLPSVQVSLIETERSNWITALQHTTCMADAASLIWIEGQGHVPSCIWNRRTGQLRGQHDVTVRFYLCKAPCSEGVELITVRQSNQAHRMGIHVIASLTVPEETLWGGGHSVQCHVSVWRVFSSGVNRTSNGYITVAVVLSFNIACRGNIEVTETVFTVHVNNLTVRVVTRFRELRCCLIIYNDGLLMDDVVTLVSAFIIGIHRPSTNELIAAFTVQVDIRSLDEERLTIVGEGVAAVVAIIGRPVRAGVDSDEVLLRSGPRNSRPAGWHLHRRHPG